jgi:uncharacterized protein YycO
MPPPAKARSKVRRKTFYIFDPDAIEPGDILLTKTPSLKSHAIRTATKTKFSHAALCIEYGHFIEAIGSGVCRFATMSIGVRDAKNVKLLRLNRTISDSATISQRAADFGHQDLMRGFSVAGAVGVKLRGLRPNQAALFCSQLVAQAYSSAGFDLLPGFNPSKIAPGYLAQSHYLEDVTQAALKISSSSDQPNWYLDEKSPADRPHQWEVRTKLKMLSDGAVRDILLQLKASPRSYYELESVLRDSRSAELDNAMSDALKRQDFVKAYYNKVSTALDEKALLKHAMQLTSAALEGTLAPEQLTATIIETRQIIRIFENDLLHRKQERDSYKKQAKELDMKTFKALGNLQSRCIGLNERVQTVLKGQLRALEFATQS